MCIDIVDYQLIKTPCKTIQEARNIYYVFHEMFENQVLAKFITDCLSEGIGFPHDQQNELALLAARSYGLPTRLIDFTLNPVVASFFAASEVDDACAENNLGRAVVWAIPRLIFTGALTDDVFRDFQNWKESSTAFAYGYSEHMRRQKAIVLQNNNVRQEFEETGLFLSFEDVLERILTETLDRVDGSHKLLDVARFTIPHKECPKLIRILSNYNISTVSLFPTADKIAEFAVSHFRRLNRRYQMTSQDQDTENQT